MRVDVSLDDTEAQALLQALGPRSMGFALANATNNLAFRIRDEWKQQATRVFDRPTALTLNAVLVRKAGSGISKSAAGQNFRNGGATAEIFLRDEAFKGTPPVKYLFAQVQGGARRHKRFERALQARGYLPGNMYAVPARGGPLDANGNLPEDLIVQILSQLQAMGDAAMNETRDSRERREKGLRRKKQRISRFFAIGRRQPLPAGIYERFQSAFGTATRMIVAFVRSPGYRPRYTVFDTADAVIRQHGSAELERAVMHELTRAFNRAGRR